MKLTQMESQQLLSLSLKLEESGRSVANYYTTGSRQEWVQAIHFNRIAHCALLDKLKDLTELPQSTSRFVQQDLFQC